MKINFDTPITALDGEPMKTPDEKIVTLGMICITALTSIYDPQSDKMGNPGQEKYLRGKLADDIFKGGEQEVKPEDITLIKKLIGMNNGFSPVIIHKTYDILNG